MANWKESRKKQAELRSTYREAHGRLSEILFEEDPVGINFGFNAGEYEPEAATLLPRLLDARSVDDVRKVVHEEFVKWFSTDSPPESYQVVAERVWKEVVPMMRGDDLRDS
jgi:hypothetical protein